MPKHRIIVGVDATPAGRAALAWAITEATVDRRQLVLARAFTPTYAMASSRRSPGDNPIEPDLEEAITSARQRLVDEGVEGIAVPGSAEDVLLEVAGPGDMVVVGAPSHRHRIGHRATAAALVHRAPGPLIVVPANGPAIRPDQPPPTHAFGGHVVVGVDGSAQSWAALDFGFSYADKHQLPLAAVHIGRRIGDTDVWFDDRFLETHLSHESPAAVMLSTMVEPLELAHPRVAVKRAVFTGRPRTTLLASARGAALLVVGRPRPGLIDSISHGVIDEAPCPTVVVHTAADSSQAE